MVGVRHSAIVLLFCACTFQVSCADYILDASWPQIPAQFHLSSVTAVAVANGTDGGTEIHVAQRGHNAPPVLVFDALGAYLRGWGSTDIVSIHGMQAAPGNPSSLWVTDIGACTVKHMNISGGLLQSVGTPGNPGSGIDPPQFSSPADIALTRVGSIAVSDGDGGTNNRVLVLGTDLSVEYGFGSNGTGPSQFQSPHSITYDTAFDRFWVADRGNYRIQSFLAASGLWVGQWDSCFAPGQPWGVRMDSTRGRMLVADGLHMALYVLNVTFGATAYDIGSCSLMQNISIGANTTPHELALDEATGDVYLAGVGSVPTIQRYTWSG